MATVDVPNNAGGTVQCTYGVKIKSDRACFRTFTFTKEDVWYDEKLGEYVVRCPACKSVHVLNRSATALI